MGKKFEVEGTVHVDFSVDVLAGSREEAERIVKHSGVPDWSYVSEEVEVTGVYEVEDE